MNRRYQDSSRPPGTAASRGANGNRGGRPRVSRDTKASPCTRASARSAGSSRGSTFAIAVSTVRPAPHPASRLRTPKSTPARMAASGGPFGPEHFGQPEDGLGDHEGQALLEALLQAP